ncbi:MAG: hypothetical protein CVU57_11065 [Deltaproteobacteria bacterium HGW-Deltaproteobacteria-15]|jgi:hypothetical protein|nr:MAG: hypothetical protein CVU57_11065 [Deltaproteobacteria bacterium HGW-Deltaproteobacteria-15]
MKSICGVLFLAIVIGVGCGEDVYALCETITFDDSDMFVHAEGGSVINNSSKSELYYFFEDGVTRVTVRVLAYRNLQEAEDRYMDYKDSYVDSKLALPLTSDGRYGGQGYYYQITDDTAYSSHFRVYLWFGDSGMAFYPVEINQFNGYAKVTDVYFRDGILIFLEREIMYCQPPPGVSTNKASRYCVEYFPNQEDMYSRLASERDAIEELISKKCGLGVELKSVVPVKNSFDLNTEVISLNYTVKSTSDVSERYEISISLVKSDGKISSYKYDFGEDIAAKSEMTRTSSFPALRGIKSGDYYIEVKILPYRYPWDSKIIKSALFEVLGNKTDVTAHIMMILLGSDE